MRQKFAEAYAEPTAETRAPRAGHPKFYEYAAEEVNLHDAKNREYATTDNPLGNFHRSGRLIAKLLKPGVSPALASCLIFMAKQVDGVYEIVGEGKTDTVEGLDDKLKDISVYCKIARILLRGE